MDADGLPIVGPSIDYTKVEAINQKRTIAFLNHFITHTARFLNRFSCVCEEKLSQLSLRIQRLETTMNILDTKLTSIPGLENVTVSTTSSTVSNGQAAENTTSVSPAVVATQDSTPNSAPSQPEEVYVEVEEAKPEKTVSQDPRYARFFKMLNMGVPMMAVKQKMGFEGLDPSLIETPHAPAPPDDALAPADDSDEDAFSDNNDSSESEMSD